MNLVGYWPIRKVKIVVFRYKTICSQMGGVCLRKMSLHLEQSFGCNWELGWPVGAQTCSHIGSISLRLCGTNQASSTCLSVTLLEEPGYQHRCVCRC